MKTLRYMGLVIGLLWFATQISAQEIPLSLRSRLMSDYHFIPNFVSINNFATQDSLAFLRRAGIPDFKEIGKEKQNKQALIQQSVISSHVQLPTNTWEKSFGAFQIRISNCTYNWSPFEDQMLDARTLSFPLPRGMKADKRPENIKALDKMK